MCTGSAPARPASGTHRLELADIVRALEAIATCRTATLGGHREVCESCGGVRITYNSCCNRHCPKCQTLAKERWLDARRAAIQRAPSNDSAPPVTMQCR